MSYELSEVKQQTAGTLWLLTNANQAWRIFGAGFRRASRLIAQKVLAIACRANATDVAKDLRKVLLGLETTGHGHVQ